MSELQKTRAKLKALQRDAHRERLTGRYNWGDYYRNQHIKSMRKQIETAKAKTKAMDIT